MWCTLVLIMYYDDMPEVDPAHSRLPRRRFLQAALIAAAASGAMVFVARNSNEHSEYPPPPSPIAYLPTWLDDASNERTQEVLRQATDKALLLGRLTLAFATPQPKRPYVGAPAITDSLKRLLVDLPQGIELGLSVGGGAYQDLKSWRAALARPDDFSQGVESVASGLEDQIQRPISTIDLDCEAKPKAAGITAMAVALRHAMPERELTMAVPALDDLHTFNTAELGGVVSEYSVMTYDQHGITWGNAAGHIAGREFVQLAADTWKDKAGADAVIRMGVPTYGYLFAGARAAGDSFDSKRSRSLLHSDLPVGQPYDDIRAGTSEFTTSEGWVSFQSPQVAAANIGAVRAKHPDVGAFFWPANGLTIDYLQAVQ